MQAGNPQEVVEILLQTKLDIGTYEKNLAELARKSSLVTKDLESSVTKIDYIMNKNNKALTDGAQASLKIQRDIFNSATQTLAVYKIQTAQMENNIELAKSAASSIMKSNSQASTISTKSLQEHNLTMTSIYREMEKNQTNILKAEIAERMQLRNIERLQETNSVNKHFGFSKMSTIADNVVKDKKEALEKEEALSLKRKALLLAEEKYYEDLLKQNETVTAKHIDTINRMAPSNKVDTRKDRSRFTNSNILGGVDKTTADKEYNEYLLGQKAFEDNIRKVEKDALDRRLINVRQFRKNSKDEYINMHKEIDAEWDKATKAQELRERQVRSTLDRISSNKKSSNVVGPYSDISSRETFNGSKDDRLTWDDAWAKGSTFGHKVATTVQYMSAGAGIMALSSAIRGTISTILEFDTASRTMSAVLDLSKDKAQNLALNLANLGTKYGGTLESINAVALSLGRAGIASDKLIDGTEVVIRMARLTGDTFETSADAIISYQQVFGDTGLSITQLGDKLAYVANVSRLSTHDIGTFSNYALSAAKSVGMTVDAVGALAASFSNAGVNASTIGTQIRRFTTLLSEDSVVVQNLFENIGVSQKAMAAQMQGSASESNKALESFAKKLAQLSDQDFANYTAGMDLLAKDSLNKIRQQQAAFSEFLDGSLNKSEGALQKTNVIMQGYAVTWEGLWNTLKVNIIAVFSTISDIVGPTLSRVNGVIQGIVGTAIMGVKELMAFAQGDNERVARLDQEVTLRGKLLDLENKLADKRKDIRFSSGVEKIRLEAEQKILEAQYAGVDAGLKVLEVDYKKADILKEQEGITSRINELKSIAKNRTAEDNNELSALLKRQKELVVVKEQQKEVNQGIYKAQVVTTDILMQQYTTSLNNGTSSKQLLDLVVKRIEAEKLSLEINTALLITAEGMSSATSTRMAGILGSNDKTIDKIARMQKLFDAMQHSTSKNTNSINVQSASIDQATGMLVQQLKLENDIATLKSATAKKAEANAKKDDSLANRSREEAKRELDRQLAGIKLAEARYFVEKDIDDVIAQKAYHEEKTLVSEYEAIRNKRKAFKDENEYQTALLDKQREILDTDNEITIGLIKRGREYDKNLIKFNGQIESQKEISAYNKIDLEASTSIATINDKYNKLLASNNELGARGTEEKQKLLEMQRLEVLYVENITKEKKAQLDLQNQIALSNDLRNISNINEATKDRLRDLQGISTLQDKLGKIELDASNAKLDAATTLANFLISNAQISVDIHNMEMEQIKQKIEAKYEEIKAEKVAAAIKEGKSKNEIDAIKAGIETDKQRALSAVKVAEAQIAGAEAVKKINADKAKLDSKYDRDYSKNLTGKLQGYGQLINAISATGKMSEEYDAIDSKDKDAKNKKQEALIDSYGALAGAMSSMFKEGSREAEAFKVVQSGLALVNAVTSVMNAGTNGDGYSAIPRMLAVAATAAGFLSQIGVALNSGSANAVSDYQAAHPDNTGTGSILGDVTAQSESITKSLDILGALAKPEFQLISSMNKSLLSIDRKIAGTAANILQAGGFATGAGGVYSSSKSRFKTDLERQYGNSTTGLGGEIAGIFTGANITDRLFGGQFEGLGGKVIGALTGANVSSYLMDKMFGGSTETSTIGAGITFNSQSLKSAMTNLVGQAFQTVLTQTDGGWFGEDSTSVYNTYQKLDDYTKTQFQLILKNLYTLTDLAGSSLGESVTGILDSMNINIGQISLMGKSGDEIQKQLEAVFSKIGDNMATTALPLLKPFQAVGEGMFETMIRVASGMQEASYYINKLGTGFTQINYKDIVDKQGDVAVQALTQSIVKLDEAIYGANNGVVDMLTNLTGTAEEIYTAYLMFGTLRIQLQAVGVSASALTASMVTGAGSLDILNSSLTAFIDNFLSVGDQFSYEADIISAQFAAIGLAMPNTAQGFKDLVDMMDTTTSSGQELYGKLIALSEGFAAVNKAAEDTIGKYLGVFAKIDKILNPDTYESLLYLQGLVTKATIDNASSIIDRLQAARDAEVASLTKQMDSITSAVAAIAATVKTLRESIIGTTGAESSYKVVYNAIRDAIANNQDFSGMTSDLNSTAIKYADVLKSQAQTSQEYIFSVAQLANEIEALGATSQTVTLSTINTSIAAIDATFKDLLTQLDANITSDFTTFLTENERYFGAQSLLIGRLTSVDDWMAQLYEVQAAARVADTAHISASTFDAGHVLGTQEKVDIARATNLTVGTDAFNTMVTTLQGFSTQSDDNSYLQQMAGVTTGSTTILHPEILKAMEALGSALPQDALDALTWLKTSLPMWAQTEYQNNLASNSAQKATLAAQIASAQQQSSYYATLASMNTGDTAMYVAGISVQWANTANQLASQLAGIQDPVLKTTFYADGGIVSNPTLGMVGEAGYPEAIIPMRNGKDIPVNMGGSFNELNSTIRELKAELVDLKNLTIKLVADNSKQLQTQRAMLAEQLA